MVLLGIVLLAFQFWGVNLMAVGWPLFVIIPGLVFLAAALMGGGRQGLGYLAVPGCIVTVVGLLLAYQNFTGDWQSWSYAWAFVAPGAVGLGLLIAGMREGSRPVRATGAWLLGFGLVMGLVSEWVFVALLGVGGRGFGPVVEAVLPLVLILAGVYIVLGRGRRREA